MFNKNILDKAEEIINLSKNRNLKIATAESCTGGLLAAAITSISGSSAVFNYGVVTYSNQSKIDLLNIDNNIIEKYGAVSKEIVELMAKNILILSESDIGISITGLAGPSGGSLEKPIGLVFISIYNDGKWVTESCKFSGDRNNIRISTIERSLELLYKIISS